MKSSERVTQNDSGLLDDGKNLHLNPGKTCRLGLFPILMVDLDIGVQICERHFLYNMDWSKIWVPWWISFRSSPWNEYLQNIGTRGLSTSPQLLIVLWFSSPGSSLPSGNHNLEWNKSIFPRQSKGYWSKLQQTAKQSNRVVTKFELLVLPIAM